jgi:thioredoxin 1
MEIEINEGNFENEVVKSDVPVMLDFWATWCGPCMMLAPVVAEIAKEREGTLKVGKVDVDKSPELAARFGIMSIPAVLLFKGGEVVAQSVGYVSKDELVAKLLG